MAFVAPMLKTERNRAEQISGERGQDVSENRHGDNLTVECRKLKVESFGPAISLTPGFSRVSHANGCRKLFQQFSKCRKPLKRFAARLIFPPD
jgi:hypothetical protein